MTRHSAARFLPAILSVALLLPWTGGSRLVALAAAGSTSAGSAAATNAIAIQPGPEDGRVAYIVARLLERLHFSHQEFDDSVSSVFLERYLESLDPQHLHFLRSDLAEFESYRTSLDDLTISRQGVADVTPAFKIFSRFMERARQRVDYMDDLLKKEAFKFDADERITLVRRDEPYPEDLGKARELWRQRVRYDYLQEKLSLEAPGKSKASSAKIAAGKTPHEHIVDLLSHRYHRSLRVFTDWSHEDVLGLYLTALAHVYDPHSDYFNREQMDNFRMGMNLQLFGIGAELKSEDGLCKIQRLLPGPAAKSKEISAGDVILEVAQADQPPVDIVDMSLSKVVQLIRGPKGTVVRLTIRPADDASSRKIVSLVRDEIALEDQAAKSRIIDLPNGKGQSVRLGVIDLNSFYAPVEMSAPKTPDLAGAGDRGAAHSTSTDVAKLLAKFKEERVSGVILDLRRNGGGSLEEAIRVAGLFIKDGPVVQVLGSDGSRQVEDDPDPSIVYEGPLVVLTSRFSASASEIVAGALQDYGRALIVGDSSTHGKGTVQNLNPLKPFMRSAVSDTNDPGALKVTIRKFYRASGASTQLKGVLPDIVLPSVLNHWKDLGESSLENPLPWDTIRRASFDRLNLVEPYLPELLKRSTERVATNRDFVYIREDIQEYRAEQADKTVSLNEKQRLEELREAEAKRKARDQERLARPEPAEKVYEITLKQAALPGLPEPVQRTNSLALKNGSGGSPGAGTNSALAALPATPASGDDPDEIKPPAVDPNLDEALRILTDYLSLLPKGSPLLATQKPPES